MFKADFEATVYFHMSEKLVSVGDLFGLSYSPTCMLLKH